VLKSRIEKKKKNTNKINVFFFFSLDCRLINNEKTEVR
jgi:hypothetical protein